ncbi:PAS domain S-box protein [Ochrobactrum sp. XJ1]|nr:PAS domain S-box protein [Ochrobactrum sp. XJ1]
MERTQNWIKLGGKVSSVHPNDRLLYLDKITNSVETGEKFEHKFRNRRWDGEYRWTQGYANPLRDEEGNIIRWYGANIDIHDQEVSQNELREKERFLSRLVETLPAMVDCAAPNGEPVYRSQQLREFLGYELEELDSSGKSRLAATLDTSVHPDDLAVVKKRYSQCLSSGEPYAHKHRLQRFDGEYRWVETRAVPMHNTASEIVQWNVICIDIDSEVRAQEALRLAQERLFRASQTASLAELSASIAHEVNQPLAAVVANSYACHRWLSATPVNLERAKQTAERLIRDANTASDIVNRIKALFKHSADERILTDIGNIISEARALLAGDALRHRVEILVEGEFGLPQLMVDRTQILQVLVNLMRNAIEAMEGSQYGRVLRINAVPTNAGVRIEISDLGIGLTEFENIFEPFVSAKINGMGMGLAICRSIVEGHGGRLTAEPNQPKGAKFIINLPTGL